METSWGGGDDAGVAAAWDDDEGAGEAGQGEEEEGEESSWEVPSGTCMARFAAALEEHSSDDSGSVSGSDASWEAVSSGEAAALQGAR